MKILRIMFRYFPIILIAASAMLAETRTANAQGGTLQFSQVLYLSANSDNTTQWTVPNGKVWKIETMGTTTNWFNIYINGASAGTYAGAFANSSTVGQYRSDSSSPIWLPATTTLGHSCSCGSNRWYSIIEFTIVP